MKKITLYCDGSCLGNPGGPGGWCAILLYNGSKKILRGHSVETTNNIMELTAMLEGIKAVKEPSDIDIYSDSQYVVKGIMEWIANWEKTNFKNIKNSNLWKEYLKIKKNHKITATWIKGHAGHPLNEEADDIARAEALKNKNPEKCNINTLGETLNVRIEKIIDLMDKNIGYKFKDKNLLIQAMTHKSCSNVKNNERLEFLGDAVVDLLVGEYLFRKFPHLQEGDLSKIRASIVSESGLSELSKDIGIGSVIVLSSSENKNLGRNKPSILSDAFEALMGAIYLDAGLDKAKNILYTLLNRTYKNIDVNKITDYKSALQEVTQALYGDIPKYVEMKAEGPDHLKSFEIALFIGDKELSRAVANSKKAAQQECAKILYNKIRSKTID